MKKRIHYFQHVPFEGLGSIQQWIDEKGYDLSVTRFYENSLLPAVDQIDFLIVMGGPMSVNDEQDYPWLQQEKCFVKQAIESGLPVLGICLGAQIIAASLGAKVYANSAKEIGWFDIKAESAASEAWQFPEQQKAFHWHGETFDLPQGAEHLASSAACMNQAFQYGQRVLGLQFHLETTAQSAKAIIENCRNELVESPFIQQEAQLLSTSPAAYAEINILMNHVLNYLDNA